MNGIRLERGEQLQHIVLLITCRVSSIEERISQIKSNENLDRCQSQIINSGNTNVKEEGIFRKSVQTYGGVPPQNKRNKKRKVSYQRKY